MSAHPIPVAALAAHLAILGKTGAGKSYAARSTVEGILARGERACIVDPTGVWWGLRLDAAGKPKGGLPVVIAGGRHGDVPLLGEDGAALARIAGGSSTPLILDTSVITVSARTKLFTGFAEAILAENVGPLHLVVDEAHLFMPQTRVPDPQSAMMVHAGNGLVALGRARGLRVMLLSQRPAKLHKDALTQVETLVAMRFTAPQDRKAVEAWIVDQADKKRGAEIVASLPTLRQGEGWVWSPDADILERVAFPSIATFDSMRPEAQGSRELAPVDVAAIRAALTAAAPPSEQLNRRTIAAQPPSAAELAAADQRGYERGYETGARHAGTEARMLMADIRARLDRFEERVASPWFYCDESFGDRLPEVPAAAPAEPRTRDVAPAPESEASPAPADGAIPPGRRRILDAIAWANATGQPEPSRELVAFLARVSSKSGGYRNNLSALHTARLIRYPGKGALALTAAGRKIARAPAAALDHPAMMERVRAVIAPARMRLLEVAAAEHPEMIKREVLAAACGVSAASGGFRNNLSGLSSLGLVTYPAAGLVRAADLLFPDRRT